MRQKVLARTASAFFFWRKAADVLEILRGKRYALKKFKKYVAKKTQTKYTMSRELLKGNGNVTT
ncbi:hypothetical protein BCV53_18140 [Parageobacillus thermoglucosidasius]|uniref:Uncharacterized protein n=1 Tax=Parageobacillus thermoglucosidasius TaxID=1426 RepID=A0AAN0YU91_PARTM|nr:hypothetical protein AOT13_18080 [Parageobacillus thermoglucosidasius]KYD14036.1 hypothetical protein B4168_0858 [Anoxybacillus flavithermus]ANZ31863.1 hypothetical protein BCV53_18140 [Parageobacillus thermoglucosidasius]APM82597.1 hypothetical protein BCV54_18155 [Parageobacillus thermoglucosidasius]KJX69848.1 hypothetical protein WH82_05330 [Parageobacillus thermoglucosidasius]